MKIKNLKGEVIFEDDLKLIKQTVENAVKSSANLRYADLNSADLENVKMYGYKLSLI